MTGTPAVGRTLAAQSGTWQSATTVAYAYHWYRCDGAGAHCVSVRGLAAPSYALAARDRDKTIGLTVTATDASGSSTAYASLVGPVAGAKPLLVSTAQPQVTGVPIQGRELQVTTGVWSPAPDAVAYSWERCNANGRICTPIASATTSTYTVGADDVGHALVASVQAAFGGAKQVALSVATTAALGGDVNGPTHSAQPTVTGIFARDEQLNATPGIWTGIGSIAYAYQWYRCDATGAHCSSIHGATKQTYTLVGRDVGQTIGLTVRATDSTGTAAAYASLVGPIAAIQSVAEAWTQPTIAGSTRPGAVVTTTSGSWLPGTTSFTYTYAWQRCNPNGRVCTAIPKATQSSYTVSAEDVGHTLVVVVTATEHAAKQSTLSAVSALVS